MMNPRLVASFIVTVVAATSGYLGSAAAEAESTVLFTNVRVFDGKSDNLSEPRNVLVCGNTIGKISRDLIATDRSANTRTIDGGGRTLMPGLIDAHTHIMFATLTQAEVLLGDIGYVNLAAGKAAEEMLLRGFTSIRDLGGPVFGLKRAIDRGLVPGPRVWPSGAFISQSGGHGDFRLPNEVPCATRALRYGVVHRQPRYIVGPLGGVSATMPRCSIPDIFMGTQ